MLVTHGAEDKNMNLIAAEYTAKMTPGPKLSVYLGILFLDEPGRAFPKRSSRQEPLC